MRRQTERTRQETTTEEALQESLTRLAAGELNVVAAFLLRRRIARDAGLRRDWEQTQRLWRDLESLQSASVPARPVWPPSAMDRPQRRSTVWTLGGMTMNRPVALAAISLLALTTVSAGAYVTNKWLHDPFTDIVDRNHHVWHVVGRFRGQVKQFDANGRYIYSFGTDWGQGSRVAANVLIDGHAYDVEGAGRHALRDDKGNLLGYAELVPESVQQRAVDRDAHQRELGLDEIIPISHGDIDGENEAIGFFGNHRELTFRVYGGPVVARFTRVDNGHVIMRGIVSGGNGQAMPTFAWTQNGRTQSLQGLGRKTKLTLPGGIVVQVELTPAPSEGSDEYKRLASQSATLGSEMGHTPDWNITGHFRGEVKEYDRRGIAFGSVGSDDSGDGQTKADVSFDGQKVTLQGTGRQAVRDQKGEIVGYVELVPETLQERESLNAAYRRRVGIDEQLPMTYSTQDVEGGENGYFGEHKELTFHLTGGPVTARFTRVDNGHVVLNGVARGDNTPSIIAPVPEFEWTQDGKTQKLRGFGKTTELTLPGGIVVKVELVSSTPVQTR